VSELLPPRPGARPHSSAERRVLDQLASDLDGRWWVLHSVGLVRHATKRWAEADFVVVGPGGVFVLEVKGGRVARRRGGWCITDRHGRVDQPAEGPFDQAGGAAGALQGELAGGPRRVDGSRVQVGYGVVLPDCELTVEGTDVDRRILFDAASPYQSFSEFVDSLSVHWAERLGSLDLGEADVAAVVAAVRPDFESRSSLRGILRDVEADTAQLTAQQTRTQQEMSNTARMIVEGGAGTGKTHLATADALTLARSGRRVLYTCHNRALARELARAHRDVPNLRIATWSSIMWGLVESSGRALQIPPDIDDESIWRAFVPQLALEAARESAPLWEAVVVDEGQDLLREHTLGVLDNLLVGGVEGGWWRWFMDPHQDVFAQRQRSIASRLASVAGGRRRLSVNCRNTSEIADVVELLSGRTADPAEVCGPPVRWFHHDSNEEDGLVEPLQQLLHDGVPPSKIAVLTPVAIPNDVREQVSSVIGARLVPEERLADEFDGASRPDADDPVRCSTIQGFKGLESEVVLLAGLKHLTSDNTQRLAYVGASRPTTILAVSLHSSETEVLAELSLDFARNRTETDRRREPAWPS
jgi:hypothetical protein